MTLIDKYSLDGAIILIIAIHFGLGVYLVRKNLFDKVVVIYAYFVSIAFFLSLFLYLILSPGFTMLQASVTFVLLLATGAIQIRTRGDKPAKRK